MLYSNRREFVEGTFEFIAKGLASDEPTLVVLSAEKIRLLNERLGADAGRVRFADMAEVGANPARIIPAWLQFAGECTAAQRTFRGIGEPIWAGRTPDELVECQRHEALLNLAFAGTQGFTLLCPYDTGHLGSDVLAEAHRSHPHIVDGDTARDSDSYRDLAEVAAPFDQPLPAPSQVFDLVPIRPKGLGVVRRTVARHAAECGLASDKTDDLVIAVNEVATNSLAHGGGHGMLRVWRQGHTVICEIRDEGRIADPLAGRVPPPDGDENGRGLWLATQLCDLVQVRTYAAGSVVRLHMRP